jgi:peptidoglycan/LPS O-acetylase OafA/YrhL
MSMTDPTTATPTPAPSGRRPALDGLRALAVTAVVLYHVDHTLVPGGYVGVDLFFVLSGYLITTLLVGEHGRSGGISLRGFWGRRIRRLWPLGWLTVGLIALASLAHVWGPDRQRTLPAELGSAIGQIANWYQVGHGGYVHDLVAPSPVRHFWSLAIEEQFYVVWPLLLAGLLAVSVARRRRRWVVPAALAALGAASIAAGLRVADSPDRAYLGTDVRAIALVVGAALAWWLRGRPMRGPDRGPALAIASITGIAGFAALVAACVVLPADSPVLPRGGFLGIAVASGAVVVFALSPTRFATAMGWRPLAWLGRVSYAVYLVHWPMLVALGPDRALWLRLVVAGPCAVVVAGVLHRFVEQPVIHRRVSLRWLTAGLGTLAAASVVVLVVSVPTGRTPTERVEADLGHVPDPSTTTVTTAPRGPGATTTTTCLPPAAGGPGSGDGSPAEAAVVDPTGSACAGQVTVLVVGDSTGRGAANGLASLHDPRLVVWDRTVLGCSFGGESCPDWRDAWRTAVAAAHPDVVVVFAGVVSDLHGVDDDPFLSDAEAERRATAFDDAVRILSADGARVLLTLPPVPLRPNGLFFCDGRGHDSACDPRWVQRWTDDLRAAASRTGASIVDIAAWIQSRGATKADRPDGVHLAGAALHAEAVWLAEQVVAAAPATPP